LNGHPKVGASWEGFAIESIIVRLGARADQCYFWSTHAGAELDLLVVAGGKRLGFEAKRTVAPRLTPSMQTAMRDLRLDSLSVIHAGAQTFPLAKGVSAIGLSRVLEDLPAVRSLCHQREVEPEWPPDAPIRTSSRSTIRRRVLVQTLPLAKGVSAIGPSRLLEDLPT
jgi:hypothetical protein